MEISGGILWDSGWDPVGFRVRSGGIPGVGSVRDSAWDPVGIQGGIRWRFRVGSRGFRVGSGGDSAYDPVGFRVGSGWSGGDPVVILGGTQSGIRVGWIRVCDSCGIRAEIRVGALSDHSHRVTVEI